jgi:hypothetical protein
MGRSTRVSARGVCQGWHRRHLAYVAEWRARPAPGFDERVGRRSASRRARHQRHAGHGDEPIRTSLSSVDPRLTFLVRRGARSSIRFHRRGGATASADRRRESRARCTARFYLPARLGDHLRGHLHRRPSTTWSVHAISEMRRVLQPAVNRHGHPDADGSVDRAAEEASLVQQYPYRLARGTGRAARGIGGRRRDTLAKRAQHPSDHPAPPGADASTWSRNSG